MYLVYVEYDGCSNGYPKYRGTMKGCLTFMRKNKAPALCQWNLVDENTGRCVSYML